MQYIGYNISSGHCPTNRPEMGKAPGGGLAKLTPALGKEATEMATNLGCNTLLAHVATQLEVLLLSVTGQNRVFRGEAIRE